MTVFSNSRYRFGDVQSIQATDGQYYEFHRLRRTTSPLPEGSVRYVVAAGDTFESLAHRFYGDADKWYVLADANPHIFWPLDLGPNDEISVPPVSVLALT